MLEINATLIIQMLNIIVLFVVVRYFLFKPLVSVIQQRQERIIKHITDAEMVRDEAEEMKKSYQKRIDQVEGEGARILKEYRDEGERIKNELIAKGKEEVHRMITHANMEIHHKREAVLRDMKDRVSTLAVDMAQRLLEDYLDLNMQKDLAMKLAERVKDYDVE